MAARRSDYGGYRAGSSGRDSRSSVEAYTAYRESPRRESLSSRDTKSSSIEDPTAKFEKGRIQVLQQERVHIQKKTFTKWCNSFLEKVIHWFILYSNHFQRLSPAAPWIIYIFCMIILRNVYLQAHLQVQDLFTDLTDGKMLMKLLEIISGETVGKPNKGVLRVQKMENVNRCLMFLASKVNQCLKFSCYV